MKFIALQYFKDNSGEWHQPGTIAEFDREEAEVFRSRGCIKAYRTQSVAQPETRVVSIPGRRRKGHAVS